MSDKKSPTKVLLYGRFSYLNIFEPRTFEGGDTPKYSLALIMNPATKNEKESIIKMQKAIEAAKENGIIKCPKWDGEVPEDLSMKIIKIGDKLPRKKREKHPEYAGCIILSCSSKDRPGVVDKDLEDILDKTKIYSGAYGRVEVNFFPYDRGSNGIGAGLNHVQMLKDGEPLAGRGSAADAFSDTDSDEEDDLLAGLM